MIVKEHDTHDIYFRANADLTGSTVRLLCRANADSEAVVLPSEIWDPSTGVVSHKLSGELAVGRYQIELEVTKDDTITTFPNDTYASLEVFADLG